MENEIPEPYNKKNSIVISHSILKKIAMGFLALVCIIGAFFYFNSGLTLKKAKRLFINEYWLLEKKPAEVKIVGIKKIKPGTYWVKIDYSFWGQELDYTLLAEGRDSNEWRLIHRRNRDYIFTKWDTKWIIEVKLK